MLVLAVTIIPLPCTPPGSTRSVVLVSPDAGHIDRSARSVVLVSLAGAGHMDTSCHIDTSCISSFRIIFDNFTKPPSGFRNDTHISKARVACHHV